MRKGTKAWMWVVVAGVLACWCAGARADAISDKRKAQNKLLAQRAARVDAIRKLAERIRGLVITSETTVRDFVAESDTIDTAMVAFLNGMKEVGRPRHMEDGTCEVVMEVTLKEVIATLKRLHKRYYKGDKIRIGDFDKMTVANKTQTLRETGAGVPRPDLAEDDLVLIVSGASFDSFTYLRGAAKAYWLARSRTPQARLMAVRAARLDALRRLGERIQGVMITSETSVRDFVAESDEIRTAMRAFIRGAREIGIRYHADELIVEVEMEITLKELIATLTIWHRKYYKGDKISIRDFEKMGVRTEQKVFRETGMGVPPEKYLKQALVTVKDKMVMALGRNAPAWISRLQRETGSAAVDTDLAGAAQAKLMAYRAAELDARRKLAERINGLMITSQTSVRDFVTQDDQIATAMLTFQQGGHVVPGSQKLLEDGTAQVTVEIDLKPLWNMVLYWQKKLSIRIK